MENALNMSPGLMLWTLFNFFILLILLIKFAVKPIINGLKGREDRIKGDLDNAAKANLDAQKFLKEAQENILTARKEMNDIIQKGKVHAEEILRKSAEEADKIKRQKVDEAIREIERSKEIAIKELRTEVAGLVVLATEKLLTETLDKDKHFKLVENYITQLPKN